MGCKSLIRTTNIGILLLYAQLKDYCALRLADRHHSTLLVYNVHMFVFIYCKYVMGKPEEVGYMFWCRVVNVSDILIKPRVAF